MKYTILNLTLFAVMGAVTQHAGLNLTMWETWAILVAAIVLEYSAYLKGRNSK